MAPLPIFLTLKNKKQLTHDVYELEYSTEADIALLPGQFLLCDTAGDPKLRRSYSVSWSQWKEVFFIIKRLPEWKGGSIAICDQEVGHIMQVWWPLGKFVLQETTCPKVFIGTGTGFAPLYFMMRKLQTANFKLPTFFLFGVRELRDVFYTEELQAWSQLSWFDYEIYCSRENTALPPKHTLGRVTEYLTHEAVHHLNKNSDTEFYICGSPAMVTEVRSMLELYGVAEEKVFFEQY